MKISCAILAFIEELVNQISAVSASPGFTWGDSGNVSAGSFLLNDSVPSNRAGRIVPLADGEITKIFVTCETNATATLEIVLRTGATFSGLTTMSLAGQRTKVETKTGVTVAEGDELACRVTSGSCRNPVVGVIIRGTNA